MKYYLIAGERSGDLHGSNLIKALKQKDAQATFVGFGGDYMQDAGMTLTVHYRDMAFMGLLEFFKNLFTILGLVKKCKEDILKHKPDVVILIDYGGFNRQIGKFCKKNSITVYYYIPPKVWAWRQGRAWSLKKSIDQMFVILPFEKDFFKQKVNWDVHYVGNPVLDAVKAHHADETFLQKHNFVKNKPLVALLPGSRKQELLRIIPVMAEVVRQNAEWQFAVATVSNLNKALYAPLLALPNVTAIEEDTYNLLSFAQAAIVTSGTATLETALFKVPQVVVYKTASFNYWIGKKVVKVKFISLVNLIANKEVVKELLQDACTPESISLEVNNLLTNQTYRVNVMQGNQEVYDILNIGSASENTADLMIRFLREKSGNF
ncbi:MAG: lipid-A-disaccharide synthase [Cyclobacteriaceae bacterium]|nr:lipid-A-disaccharide synthase [Cyclobacteriaceae bacterium]